MKTHLMKTHDGQVGVEPLVCVGWLRALPPWRNETDRELTALAF